MTTPTKRSKWMSEEHVMLEDMADRFISENWLPKLQEWRQQGEMDRETWREGW